MVALTIGGEALAAVVRERLLVDYRLASQPIDVCCCEGCVSLVGCVDTPEQKELAVQLVTGLIGVRRVKDEIVVRSFVPPGVVSQPARTQLVDDGPAPG